MNIECLNKIKENTFLVFKNYNPEIDETIETFKFTQISYLKLKQELIQNEEENKQLKAQLDNLQKK